MTVGMIGFFDPVYFLFLAPAMILAGIASMMVRSTYARAAQIQASSGVTGAQAASMILEAHDIHNVAVEESHGGTLSDHYDPKNKVLRLSPEVFHGHSVAALGIAAHEAGHAVQDKVKYPLMGIRNGIVPMASIASPFSGLLLMAGIVLGGIGSTLGSGLIWAGIILFSTVVLFQVVNLPVEFNASSRAKELLRTSNLVAPGEESRAMGRVLNAAAMTYVAATLTAILTLVYYLVRSGALDRRN